MTKKTKAKQLTPKLVSPIPLGQDLEQGQQVLDHQRDDAERLARKIEGDEPLMLDTWEREFVAALLRFFASDVLPKTYSRNKQGPEPKFDAGSEAILYKMHVAAGRDPTEVMNEITNRVQASLAPDQDITRKGIEKRIMKLFREE